MGRKTGQVDDRAARLRAALRANLTRRKEQARARKDEADGQPNADRQTTDSEQAVKDGK